ncbi:hypothetical protein IU11_11720 [Cellulosimicrobium sp. MM]|nr:hypothetical protein IU11_11720 [Cellulosimicrobium sp. MM]
MLERVHVGDGEHGREAQPLELAAGGGLGGEGAHDGQRLGRHREREHDVLPAPVLREPPQRRDGVLPDRARQARVLERHDLVLDDAARVDDDPAQRALGGPDVVAERDDARCPDDEPEHRAVAQHGVDGREDAEGDAGVVGRRVWRGVRREGHEALRSVVWGVPGGSAAGSGTTCS